ncbi:MAG: PAS domain S-box protein [Candidatus Methanofastidiosia archaeon]|jgi:PAS domain S-box-containing protein
MTEVLIVEDELIVAEDIQSSLVHAGYTVCGVTPSGKEAISKAEKTHPDIALVDIVLQGDMDGIETAEKLYTVYGVPVVFLTAYHDEKTLERAKLTKPYGYLLKPIQETELHTTIKMALYKHTIEKKIQESEQWLATTLQSIKDGVITADTEGIITLMNPAAEDITGYTYQTVSGIPIDAVLTLFGESGEKIDVSSLLNTHFNAVLVNKDKKSIPIHGSSASIKNEIGKVTGSVIAFQDMSTYKEIERELRESEEKYKHIVENSIDGVGMAQNGKIIFVNDAYCSIFGYKKEELIGENITKVVAPEDVPLIEKQAKKRFNNEPVPSSYVFTGIKKDGTQLFIEVSASEPFEYKGNPTILAVLRDVTKRKKAEMQLKNLFEASKLINSTMDTESVFQFVAESVQQLVGFDRFIIFLLSGTDVMYPAYAIPDIKEDVKKISSTYTDWVVYQCIENTQSVLLTQENALDIPGYGPAHSEIVIPLMVEKECVGALYMCHCAHKKYTQTDVDALKPLSEVVSSAIRNSRLHQEISELNIKLKEGIAERARRIEIISTAKQDLQKETSWEKGLKTIVESVDKLGFERCGVFLVDSLKKTLDFHFGMGHGIKNKTLSVSLKDTEYFGVKCVVEKRTIHVKNFETVEGRQITSKSPSFVWVPIIVRNEAFAALAADNVESNRVITEDDVKDLEILAGLCAAFIDRTRLLVEPAAENKLHTQVKHQLESGECYIILEKKPKKSFEIFLDFVTHEVPGFVATRIYPEKIKRNLKLQKTPVMWLSRTQTESAIDPNDLSKLVYTIENFSKKAKESVILLDGLEYLITQTTFESVLRFLRDLRDIIVLHNSRLLIPLHAETLSVREFSLFEREMEVLEFS